MMERLGNSLWSNNGRSCRLGHGPLDSNPDPSKGLIATSYDTKCEDLDRYGTGPGGWKDVVPPGLTKRDIWELQVNSGRHCCYRTSLPSQNVNPPADPDPPSNPQSPACNNAQEDACHRGTLRPVADTATEYKWSCVLGGTSVSCAKAKPNRPETCTGTGQYNDESSCTSVSGNDTCKQQNGCWVRGDPVPGQCGSTCGACTVGRRNSSPACMEDGPHTWRCEWTCHGQNRGRINCSVPHLPSNECNE